MKMKMYYMGQRPWSQCRGDLLPDEKAEFPAEQPFHLLRDGKSYYALPVGQNPRVDAELAGIPARQMETGEDCYAPVLAGDGWREVSRSPTPGWYAGLRSASIGAIKALRELAPGWSEEEVVERVLRDALAAGLVNRTYPTVRYGEVASFEGEAEIAFMGQRVRVVGFRPGGDAQFLAHDGGFTVTLL